VSQTNITAEDLEIISTQLGRPARDIVEVCARCVCGNPIVVLTRPRLEDGTPFPTLYYLTAPAATAAVSTLEATGLMTKLQQLLLEDPELEKNYHAAHESYLADRNLLGEVPEIEGISAGGMPSRVKCLHSLVAHSLAKGPGVNRVGDMALEACSWSPNRCLCEK
jgi:hypothetical protein